MPTIVVDAETYSEADLKLVGAENYARHPSTRVLMWAVRAEGWHHALVYEEPNIWLLLKEIRKAGLRWSASDPLDIVHWGPFDRLIARSRCIASFSEEWKEMDEMGAWEGPNNTRWGDLSEISLLFGGPVKLKWAAEFWAGHMPKEEGSHLVSRFCKPHKGERITGQMDPERWEQFRAYCARDVDATWEVMERLRETLEETGEDLDAHAEARGAVSAMNARGVPMDVPALVHAANVTASIGSRLKQEIWNKYGLNVNAPAQVSAWLGTENAQRETLEEGLDEETTVDWTPEQVEVAEARLVVSGAAVKKLDSLIQRATDDGRVHDAFVYHGAWTRRATSMRPQMHNLVRQKIDPVFFDQLVIGKYDEDPGVFRLVRNNIRGFVKAPDGHELIAGDYSQIELRVAAWLAGEDWLVTALERGEDVYRITAGNIYYCEPKEIDTDQRQLGKTVELGSQFGLSGTGIDGTGGLYARLQKDGIEMPAAECKRIIQVYRDTHPHIVYSWGECEEAVYIATRAPVGTEITILGGRVVVTRTTNAIKITRPSGFSQYLWFPSVEEGQWPDGGPREELQYIGRGKHGGMAYLNTYGGKIFQGIVQGTAADVMYYGLALAERAGWCPVMSVHDELVCCPPIGFGAVEGLCFLMCVRPDWAQDLPLKAEGGSGQRFTKF